MSLLLGFVALAAPTASAASTAEALAGKIREFPIPTAQSAPGEIETGSDGTLWFTELFGNQIGRITTAGSITEFAIPTANSTLFGITTGPDQNIWFAEDLVSANNIGQAQ
jgi:virginiamycin B lyase